MSDIIVTVTPPPDVEVTVSAVGLVGPAGPSASTEAIQDIVGAMVAAGTGITVTYDDAAGTLTIAATGGGGGGGGYTQEQIEDFLGVMATDSGTLDFTYDDAAGTVTAVVKPGSVTEAMLAFPVATQAELDTEATSRASGDAALDGRLDTVEATLPTKADLSAGTVPDAQIHSSIARGTEVTAAVAAEAAARATAISTAVSALVDGAPGVLDTLGEIAAQLSADESGAAALATTVAGKQPLDADLTAIAGLDSSTAGALVTDGAGWLRKTYTQLKTSLALVKADVGLGNVDNTSDASKPVSTATQTAIDAKQPLDSDLTTIAAIDSTTTGVMASAGSGWVSRTYAQIKTSLSLAKGDVGLGNVDNTADSAKPVSTAQQTAIDAAGAPKRVAGPAGSGNWIPLTQSAANSAGGALIFSGAALGRGAAIPFTVARSFTPTAFAINVTTLAASSFVRLGIYADNGAGKPGALITDYGQVDTSTTGVKTWSNSTPLIAGTTYWQLVVVQGAGNGTLQVNSNSMSPGVDVGDPTAATALTTIREGYDITGVTGAMPGTLTATTGGVNAHPRVVAQVP